MSNQLASATDSTTPAEVLKPLTESGHFARFALGLSLSSIPPEIVTLAKRHLLDALGIALASTSFEFGEKALAGVRALGEGTQATALGSGVSMSANSAALINGILAHGLDFDDTHIGGIYHASAPALAATLPAGQANHSSGEQVLVAFIAALEIGCRLGLAGSPDFHHKGWHTTGLVGTFAAAAAAGVLYGCDEAALVSAMGLCGSQAAGILEIADSWLKRLHPGWAAHCGITAVALGKAGFKGPRTVFEGPRGFYATHLGRIPAGDALPSVALGEKWETLGIALKPYPCCHFIHAFVDAALELRGQFPLDQVERIDCPLSKILIPLVYEPQTASKQPKDPYTALFSVPYAVALALSRGTVSLPDFHDRPLNEPEVLALAAKVFCTPDPESDFPKHFPGEVSVTLKDGRNFRVRRFASLGSPDFPLSQAAVVEKFMSNATRVLSEQVCRKIVDVVLNLEHQSSLDELLKLSTAGFSELDEDSTS